MLRLFKIEWLKIKTYRTFWILLGAFFVLYPLAYYFFAKEFMASGKSQQEEVLKSMMGNPFLFPRVWLSSSYFGGLFFVMIGMLFILLITNEVQYKTHRQNIIDGWSRMDFLKAKLSVLIFFVLISTALVFLCGLLVGMKYSPAGYDISNGLYYIGYFALMATMYLMVAYVIAILVKRTGLSIIIYFAFVCLVDNILWLVLTLKGKQIGYFLPLESTDSLVPNPFKPASMERRTVADSSLIIAASAYIIVFGYFIASYFRRIDLKT
jgi:ABC-2 type transport system permease protein